MTREWRGGAWRRQRRQLPPWRHFFLGFTPNSGISYAEGIAATANIHRLAKRFTLCCAVTLKRDNIRATMSGFVMRELAFQPHIRHIEYMKSMKQSVLSGGRIFLIGSTKREQ